MRITTVTPMKDEGPFVLEWLAYHRLIGVNDPIVLTNDCTDGTDLLLDRLDLMGLVRHLPNPTMLTGSGRHHWTVLDYANLMGRLRTADWVFSFDADEFLVVNAGDGTLAALFEALPEAEAIAVNQLVFGTGGVRHYEDRLVIEQFRRCQPLAIPEGQEGRGTRRGVKTLTSRRAGMERMSNHAPAFADGRAAGVKWVNGAGMDVPLEGRGPEMKVLEGPHVRHDLVQLNHYALRSAESFLVQAERGNANHPDKPSDMRYWRRYDQNHVEDRAIARWIEPVRAEVARLREDPEVDRLHRAAVAHHRARIEALKAEDHYANLWERTKVVHDRTWAREGAEAGAG